MANLMNFAYFIGVLGIICLQVSMLAKKPMQMQFIRAESGRLLLAIFLCQNFLI